MFDVGFWELVVIGIVALLVLGPERLPVVARTAGLWYGKMRHFVGSVKADIDRELKAEELKRIVQEQTASSGLYDIVEETRAAMQEIHGGLEDTVAQAAQHVDVSSAAETGDRDDAEEITEKITGEITGTNEASGSITGTATAAPDDTAAGAERAADDTAPASAPDSASVKESSDGAPQ